MLGVFGHPFLNLISENAIFVSLTLHFRVSPIKVLVQAVITGMGEFYGGFPIPGPKYGPARKYEVPGHDSGFSLRNSQIISS